MRNRTEFRAGYEGRACEHTIDRNILYSADLEKSRKLVQEVMKGEMKVIDEEFRYGKYELVIMKELEKLDGIKRVKEGVYRYKGD